jgi:hypothetical protein
MHYGGDGRRSKSIWAHEPILTTERKLWRAVLEQAYADAEMPLPADGSELMESTLARRFLRADGASEAADLELVCDFADVPMDRLVLWARRRYQPEEAPENGMECGSPAVAFSAGPFLGSEGGSKAPAVHNLLLD